MIRLVCVVACSLGLFVTSCSEEFEEFEEVETAVVESAVGGDWLDYDSTVGEELSILAHELSLDLPLPFCFESSDAISLTTKQIDDALEDDLVRMPPAQRDFVEDLLTFPDYRGFLISNVPVENFSAPGTYSITDFLYLPFPTAGSRPLVEPGGCGKNGVLFDLNPLEDEIPCCCKLSGTENTGPHCGCPMVCQNCPPESCTVVGSCAPCPPTDPIEPFIEEECDDAPVFSCSTTIDSIAHGVGMIETCLGL